MSRELHAQRTPGSSSSFTPISGVRFQRKCACGGSSGLTGYCPECEKSKLIGQPLRTKMRINESADEYEQEADRVADEVMKIPEAFPHPTAMADPGSVRTASITGPQFIHGVAGAGALGAGSVRREQGDGNAFGRTSTVFIQRKPDGDENAQDRGSPDKKAKNAELEYHSALHFNRSFSGFNPTAEPEEGGYGIVWWSVWNTGWRAAPEHINKFTLYNADLCSGCRNDKDEISRSEIPGPAIVPGTEPGKSEYENALIVGPLAAGHYDAYVELDVRNQVEEINEDNNRAFMVFHIRPGKETESASQATVQRKKHRGSSSHIGWDPDANISRPNSGGQPLDAATREFFSARFGHDFANVRVHADAGAAESARAVNALAYTVGRDVVFAAGQYAPGTRAGRQLLAHELTHVVQQSGQSRRIPETQSGFLGAVATSNSQLPIHGAHADSIQRQPATDGPTIRDLPVFLEKLELDVGNNLLDYGHHLYQAASLHPDEPEVLKTAFGRYALGLNVLKDSYRFAGFKPDTADKLALGTGILFKGLTFLRAGELSLDFQVNLGRGVKFETNLNLGVNPKDVADIRKADVTIGLVGRF